MLVVRIPFTYMNFYEKRIDGIYELKLNFFDNLDWLIEQCSKRGIYVILDLQGAFGSQNGQDHSGEEIKKFEDVTFYKDENLKKLTLNMWKEILNRYKINPAVAGYDNLNEPGEKSGSTKNYHSDFYNEIYKDIRSVDPNHIIIFESCWTIFDLPQPSRYRWENIVYEFHHYIWSAEKNSFLH